MALSCDQECDALPITGYICSSYKQKLNYLITSYLGCPICLKQSHSYLFPSPSVNSDFKVVFIEQHDCMCIYVNGNTHSMRKESKLCKKPMAANNQVTWI